MSNGKKSKNDSLWFLLLFLILLYSIWTLFSQSQNEREKSILQENISFTTSAPSTFASIISSETQPPTFTPPHPDITNAFIYEVLDGDTIVLSTGEKVRLLGINAPEQGQPYSEESTKRLRELIEGKKIILEKDIEDIDQYGRLLRYIFFNNENINVKMVREGLAFVWIEEPNIEYQYELKQAENEAHSSGIGIWTLPIRGTCNKCIEILNFHWNAQGDDCINLNDEYVTFINICSYSCDLTQWKVKDNSSRKPFVFPEFTLASRAAVTLYTGCGSNNNTGLYWCSSGYGCNAIWNNDGDTLYMWNSDGELVLKYPYTGFPFLFKYLNRIFWI